MSMKFIPTRAIREKANQLLAADTATFAQAADPNHLVPLMEDFASGESTLPEDCIAADFDGSTPLELGLGAQPEGLNPGTNDSLIHLEQPDGGARWETTGTTNLPQTIYGFAHMNEAHTVLYGTHRLDTPIVLTAANQALVCDSPFYQQRANAMS